jgi:hypothetical protein
MHNILLFPEECIHRKTKQTKMCSSQNDNSNSNLLLDVPIEILQIYSNFLDLKSNVMFNCVCKRTCDEKNIARSKFNTLLKMFTSVSHMVQDLYDVFGTIEGQNRLLASMLRRLIYSSVSKNTSYQNEVSYVATQTLEEYRNIMRLTMETMGDDGLSVFDFNNLLEDVQFEFRGFQIVNITKQRREQLDKMKSIIRNHYFSHDFTVYTYTTFGDMFLEFQCNKENMMIDIHERLDDEIFSWSFLVDIVKAFNINNPEHVISKRMKENNFEIKNNVICWNKQNDNGVYVFTEIVKRLIDCSSIYKGSNDNIVEIWNDTVENNWLLKDVVSNILNTEMYSFMLRSITNSVQDDFYDYNIDEAVQLL